jgi:type I restriction enzyme, S subunit
MKTIKYKQYKNSSIEWLGDIPKHWEVKRVKDVTETKSGTTPTSNNKSYYENGLHNWIRTTDLNNGELYDVEYKITDLALAECGLKFFPLDTILVAMYGGLGTIGKNAILKKVSTINQSICAIFPNLKKFEARYFLYFLKYFRNDWILFADGARKDPNINQDAVKNLFFYYPPLTEQTAIANYLDEKTAAIDTKTRLFQQKITHYQALRKSIVHETVCRGLDKNAPLRPSGIEWIGDVPKHWDVKRLKDLGFLYSGLSGKSGNDFQQEIQENSKPFIPFTNIANNTYLAKDHLSYVKIAKNENQNRVQKHDIFFLMSSEGFEDVGKSAILIDDLGETYLNSFCKGFRITKKNNNPCFVNYALSSYKYRQIMAIEGKGFTRINLKMEKVNDFELVLPPLPEQTAIATYLDAKTATIDGIIGNLQEQIKVLSALRKALIQEVVTGQRKVC